jgi:TfoX/Sxy family transcriptional regulator of competence genes
MAETGTKPKMTWEHAPETLVQTFMSAVHFLPGVQVRKMFGYPCAFFQGQMFTGLHQSSMILRLADADRAEFLKINGAASFEPMPGRPMREYVVVPAAVLEKAEILDFWLERSFKYAASLPLKAPRKKK